MFRRSVLIPNRRVRAAFYIGLLLLTAIGAYNLLAAPQSVRPTISELSPPLAVVGSTVTVTISGSNLVGVSAISISGSGVTVAPLSGGSPGSLSATITVASGAPLGPRSVTITAIGGTSAPCSCFTVLARNWSPTGSMNTSRYSASSAVLRNGKVLVSGGMLRLQNANPQPLASAELFDPNSGQWTNTASMNMTRASHSSVLLPDGRVFVIGGTETPSGAEIYDPNTETWSLASPMSAQGRFPTATLLPNGKVLVVGSSGEIYDPTADFSSPTFQSTFTLQPRTATSLASGKVLITGNALGSHAELFDPTTLRWTETGATIGIQNNIESIASLLLDGRVLLLVTSSSCCAPFTGTQVYDPIKGIWQGAPLGPGVEGRTATVLPNGKLLLVGGDPWLNANLYDPALQQWAVESPMTTSRTFHTAALLQDGRVLVAGGTAQIPVQFGLAPGGIAYSTISLASAEIYTPSSTALSYPPPTLVSVSPNSAPTGSGSVTITVNGSNFLQNSIVQLNGNALATTFVNSTKLTAIIPATSFTSPAILSITVQNAPPGGGVSGTVSFSVIASTSQHPSTGPLPISEVETGSVQTGYIIITPDSGTAMPIASLTYGVVQNGRVQSKAGVLPTTMTTNTSTAVEVLGNITRNLGLALVNPNNTANTVRLTLKDENGSSVGTPATITLNPYKQVAHFVNELFPSSTIGPSFLGSVNLQSTTPFAPLALAFTGSSFSTITLGTTGGISSVPSRTLAAGTAPETPRPGVIGGSISAIFPQFAFGGGWATQLTLVNTGSNIATGRVDVFDSGGSPTPIKWNGSTKSTFTYSIPAGGTFLLAPRDQNGQSPL